jgi:rhodanese-related sulfurtransferase
MAPVAGVIPEIGCQELRQRLESGDEIVLVDALSPISYAAVRLPGAVNIPPREVDRLAERWIPDLDTEVVVYCANRGCDSSVDVAQRLAELGYTNVRHFAGGKVEWRESGLPFEGARA